MVRNGPREGQTKDGTRERGYIYRRTASKNKTKIHLSLRTHHIISEIYRPCVSVRRFCVSVGRSVGRVVVLSVIIS